MVFCRLSMLDAKYRVIKTPTNVPSENTTTDVEEYAYSFLGRSETGIYYTKRQSYHLWVWALDESHDMSKWVLKYDVNLAPLPKMLETLSCYQQSLEDLV